MLTRLLAMVDTGAATFAAMNGITGLGGFLLSWARATSSEKQKNEHEFRMASITAQKEKQAAFVADTQDARHADSFTGWTRRIVTFCIMFVLISVVILPLFHVPIIVPTTKHYSFLGISFDTVSYYTANGFYLDIWIPELISLCAGFYFGRG